MNLDRFIDDFFGNIMSNEGVKVIKDIIQKDMNSCGYDYNTAKVECQIFDSNKKYEPTTVEISSESCGEGYGNNEIISLDCYLY